MGSSCGPTPLAKSLSAGVAGLSEMHKLVPSIGLTVRARPAGSRITCPPWLCRLILLPQFECHRIGTGLAVLEPSCGLGKMVSVLRNPGLLKIHDDKSCRHEGFPVVRKRPMKPNELRCKMGPRRTRAFLRLKVRKAPAITYLSAGFRHGCTVLWKTGMGEHQNGHPVSFQDAVERFHGCPKVGSIHEHIVRNHHVKVLVIDSNKLGAGIHAEVHIGIVCTGDRDHSLGEVDTRNTSALVTEFFGQIPCAAPGVEYREPVDVACEFPQNGVGI